MDFELTISGLCLVVMKAASGQEFPTAPTSVEIFCPAVANHRALLSYAPENVQTDLEPELVLDHYGKRYAALDLTNQVWTIEHTDGPESFTAAWGNPTNNQAAPASVAEEPWLYWVPRLHEIGFYGFETPKKPGYLPTLGATRITLPYGSIYAADIIRDEDEDDGYAKWEFPEVAGLIRALGNHMVFQAPAITRIEVTSTVGANIAFEGDGTFRMALSHDMAQVPREYNDGSGELHHLMGLYGMGGIEGDFKPPRRVTSTQTAKPICNGVIYVEPDVKRT